MTSPGRDTVELLPNGGWDERILVCRCGPLVNCFIVVTARYLVFVDTLINGATAAALLAIAEPWRVGRQLLAVNTHADWDHAWGNHMFVGPQAPTQAPIIATRRCAERLRSPEAAERLAAMRAAEPGRFDDVQLTPPTLRFEERLAIDGGDLTLELFATPGHQPDHISIFIPELRALLAGDAAELPFPFVESAAAMPELRASIARMAALEPQTALYCHAPVGAGPELLRQNGAYFDLVEGRCRKALARGVPARPPADADLEALVEFPFAEAVPAGYDAAALADSYRGGHQATLRAMLEYLGGPAAPGE
jgi:glyoxylase-like metal-dependent hydrolase (beta-lactamase superfamily II)